MFDWLRDRRNAWLGRADVRDRLAALPFGGRIAEGHADRLFRIVTGFAQSQMLAAALDLGCFDRLAVAPLARDALADLPPAAAHALATAMIALGLWEERGDRRIALTIDGLVVATDPGIRAMIAHHRLLYADLADPVAALRRPGSGALAAFWPYAGGGAGASGDYSALMAASQGFVTTALIAAHDFARHAHVMDVGGGDGGVVIALASRYPRLALTLVDLPRVAPLARTRLAAAGLDRVRVEAREPGEPLPAGADAITLVRLLHDLDDDAALALLHRVADALPVGGTTIVAEPMLGAGRDSVAAYFAAYFVAMGSGRMRSPAQIGALLRTAGLSPRRHRHRFLLDVIVADKRKPSRQIDNKKRQAHLTVRR